jgi:hypothetical protein
MELLQIYTKIGAELGVWTLIVIGIVAIGLILKNKNNE